MTRRKELSGRDTELTSVKAPRLARLFKPESVAVVGVTDANDYSRRIIQNLTALEYPGPVYAVNPNFSEFAGYPCVPSLSELPFVPDAIAVAVGPGQVASVIAEAAALGVGSAVVFNDTQHTERRSGDSTSRLEDVARAGGVALVGPNCQGIVNFHDRSALYLLEVGNYKAGHVALIAQSGGVAEILSTNRRGVRWSHLIASGNEIDVTAADFLEYLVDQEECRAICLFLETIRRPEKFFSECDRARAAGKPVIVLKAGRTEAASKAAETHSGALALPDRLLDALMVRHGVLRVDTLEELLATALAVQARRRPVGKGIGVITGSGGLVELVLDASAELDIEYPSFAPAAAQGLEALLSSPERVTNPLDVWPMRNLATDFPKVLSYVAEDPRVDIVVTLTHFDWFPTSGMHNSAFGVNAVRGYSATTPTLLALLDPVDGAPPSQIVEAALAEDVLVLSGLDSGLRALENLVGWCQPTPAPRTETGSFPQAEILRLLDEMDGRPTSGMEGLRFLRAAGFNVAESRIAHDPEEAVAFGLELGFPLVLKLGDATLLHKTEAGGVRVGIRDVAAIRRTAAELFALGAASVLVQRQIPDGAEVILGTQHNSELGGFVMVGLGGIWAEIADDVIFRPVGLRSGESGQMLSQLRGYRSLKGARGGSVIDDAAVQEAIYRIDSLAALLGPRVAAIDVNPLIVGPEGPVAVDVVVVPGGGT